MDDDNGGAPKETTMFFRVYFEALLSSAHQQFTPFSVSFSFPSLFPHKNGSDQPDGFTLISLSDSLASGVRVHHDAEPRRAQGA
jgi:hypothetical protein